MKTFTMAGVPPLPEIASEMIDGKRYYATPDGKKLPSVTTVLGFFEAQGIMKWRNQVGEAEANRISKMATGRGTRFHKLTEDYLQNKEINFKKLMPNERVDFQKFTKILNRIDNIHHIEAPLFSTKLGVAGRTDLIGEFDNTLSIIDHKTSNKPKIEEYIQHYFEQEAAYAIMYYHQTGIIINQIVILMSVAEGEPIVFIKNTEDYIKPLKEKIRKYKEIHNVF